MVNPSWEQWKKKISKGVAWATHKGSAAGYSFAFTTCVPGFIFAVSLEFLLKLKNTRLSFYFTIVFVFFLKMPVKNSDSVFFLAY